MPPEPPSQTWAGTVNGDDLRAAIAEVRRGARVRIEAVPHGVWLRMSEREDRHCRLLSEDFPDHRLMLTSLGEATTRATVSKDPLLRALEEHPGERIALHVGDHGVTVRSADDEHSGIPLPATVTGEDLQVRFEMTTLYPAVSTAIGPVV